MQHNAAEQKQMDEFFSEVTVIRVMFNGKIGEPLHIFRCPLDNVRLLQAELVRVKEAQEKLLAAHDKSKVITRSADMMEIRETMQVLSSSLIHNCCKQTCSKQC